jgi:hypothetical protein
LNIESEPQRKIKQQKQKPIAKKRKTRHADSISFLSSHDSNKTQRSLKEKKNPIARS